MESIEQTTTEQLTEQAELDLTSRQALNKAAIDMNEIMGLEPPIDTDLDDVMFMKAFTKAAEMAAGTDNFSDFTWQVLKANDLGPVRVLPKPLRKTDLKNPPAGNQTSSESADKGKQASNKQASNKQASNNDKKAAASKGPGVIASIRQICKDTAADQSNNIVVLTDVLDKLVALFPERSKDSLMATIRTQIPGRVHKEVGLSFDRQGPGQFRVSGTPLK